MHMCDNQWRTGLAAAFLAGYIGLCTPLVDGLHKSQSFQGFAPPPGRISESGLA
jgi:hypothetical protein